MKIEKRIGAALTASALALSLFAAPLENVPLSLGATVSAQEQVVSEYISVNTSSLPDSRELEQMYIDSLFYGGGFSFYKDYGKDHLTGASLEIYTLLRSKIEAVANGTAVETSFAVSMNEKFSDGNDLDSGLEKAINALMVDLPSNFYWYDKTVGYSYSYTSDGPKVTKLIFEVSENYRPANSKTETVNYSDGSSQTFHISVDSSKINAAKKAAQTAQEFANSCSDMSDYDKIIAFSDKICELTDYNHPAADDDSTPYGDPWQLVYVFDGDPDTKVVCEGYSKAFQYLCDLSGIDCYTVSGLADATDPNSGHMWNIVVLGGKSYLVDVTYKDSGWDTVLNGVEENTADGFIACNDTRKYDSDTLALYPSSVLTLSTEPYTPNVAANEVTISVTPGDGEIKVGEGIDFTVEVTSEEEISGYLDCTYDSDIVSVSDGTDSEDGTGTVYTVTGIAEGIATLTFEWTSDEIKLDEPCTVTCTVTVTAAECEHEWSKNWEKDADGHWQLCTKCGAKSDVEEHDEISADNGEDADCTKDGKEADTVCSVCEYKIKEGKVIPKTDHTPGDPVREDSVAATCTEDGYYNEVIKCKVCGHIISTEKKIIEKLGHTPSAAVRENVTEAKCTENGFYDEVVKCGVCNEELSRASVVLTATGHDPADIWSSDGTSHWYECRNSGCTEHISEAAHTEDGGTVTVTPDETNPGTRVYSCTVCGEELRTETIPVLEENHIHNYTIKNSDNTSHWDECVCGDKLNVSAHTPASKDEIVNEANCGRDGLKYVITYCIDCGRESGRTTAVIPQTTEHNTDGVDYTYDPAKHWKNCKVCGARQNEADHIAGPAATDTTPQTCTECGYEIAPVLAHTHTYATTWTHDDNFHWHAATCQHTDEVSGKAVHAWDSGVITTQPTETAKGVKTFTCTVCKATKTEPVSELAHTHTPSDAWRFDITGHWHVCSSCDEKVNFAAHNTVSEVTVAPTVTIPGKRRYYCSICRYVIREEVIPATGAVDVRPSTPVTAPVIPVWMNSNTASAEPVLDNGSGKSGWRSIANDIKKASNGDTVYVDMNGTTKLPKTVLRELIGKNVDLVLEMSGDITWTINGETVTKTSDANMAAKLNTNNIPAKVAEKLSEDGKVVQISLSHSGNFGFDAVMTVYLGTIYNGKYANLMYYNPASGEAEFIDCSLITNGNASLDFTHASEYAIVISDNPMGDYEDVSAAAGAFENDINVSSAAYVSIIAVIAAAMLIFRKKAIK